MLRKLVEQFPGLVKLGLWLLNAIPFRNKQKIRGKGNRVINKDAYLKGCNICISGNNNTVKIGQFCRLYNTTITIEGNGNLIDLGDFVYANKGDFYMEDDKGVIRVEEHTTFAGAVHLACIEGKTLSVGKRCLFSSNITVRVGDSHSLLDLEGNRINPSLDVQIGEHVWVGAGAMILKGVQLHKDCVVGTGAVVTRSTEGTNCVLAGNPAKVVKTGINWENERI